MTSSVTGLVTPRRVKSPVTFAVLAPVGVTLVDLKVIFGKFAASNQVLPIRSSWNPGGGVLSTSDFGSLIYHVGLVVFVGSAVLVMFRERLSQALEAALFWAVIGFILVLLSTGQRSGAQVAD